MPTDVNHDNTAYRRGLVLGYTMAEIVLLIIFILLLLTSFINFKKTKEIKSLENELAQNKNSLQKYKPLLDETSKRFSDVNDFDDLFQKLILAERNKEKDKEIVQKLNHLQNKANLLKEINTKLKERLHTEVNDKSISSTIGLL